MSTDKNITGKIVKGIGGLYYVETPIGTYACKARGLFRLHGQTPLVGDNTLIQVIDEEKNEGYLLELFERKNELIRPKIANVGLNLIVVSAAKPRLNFELLDSLLIYSESQNLETAICVNKTDMADAAFVVEIKRIYESTGYRVFCTCALPESSSDMADLLAYFSGKAVIFSGPSGTGKTSLLNVILPGFNFKTGALSRKTGRGAHTTRHAEFLRLPIGDNSKPTYICDTPGFTSFNLSMLDKRDLKNHYPEFTKHAASCFYNNCLHISEHDCAVKAEIGKSVTTERYDRYVRMMMNNEKL